MTKDKIKKLIRRYKVLVYGLILSIGVFMILYASYTPDFYDKHMNKYNVLIGIGCSIISSVIVTVILLVLLPDASDEKNELDEWGICKIYNERSSIKITQKQLPKHVLNFIAFGLSHFRGANADIVKFTSRINAGLNVKIITMSPDSAYLLEQQIVENNKEIKKNIEELVKWVDNVKRHCKKDAKGSIELKFYDSLPLDFFCQSDQKVFVGPYIPGQSSGETITYCYSSDSKGGKYYTDNFEKIWNGESKIKMLNRQEKNLYIAPEVAIENIMKYFCLELQGNLKEKVIGVVVIFKEDRRRTFFSINKNHEERHVCHEKKDGTVGKLVELNAVGGTSSCIIWSDYQNDMSFIYRYEARKKVVIKGNHNIEKLKNNEDTKAILAFPLFVDNKQIGALTFDFASLPVAYETKTTELLKLKCDAELSESLSEDLVPLFTKAKECGDIVVHLLGNAVSTKYKSLYEEEW